MSAIEPTAIRQRIATAIGAAETAWRETRFPLPMGRLDSRQVGHVAFAVGLGATAPGTNGRKKTSAGICYASTEINTSITYTLQAGALVSTLDAAIDAGHDLVRAVLTASQSDINLEWLSTSAPTVDADGTLAIISARFRATHNYSLA